MLGNIIILDTNTNYFRLIIIIILVLFDIINHCLKCVFASYSFTFLHVVVKFSQRNGVVVAVILQRYIWPAIVGETVLCTFVLSLSRCLRIVRVYSTALRCDCVNISTKIPVAHSRLGERDYIYKKTAKEL